MGTNGTTRLTKSNKVNGGVIRVRRGLRRHIRVCQDMRRVIPKVYGAICAQKASSDSGFGNGRLRFLGSCKMPEKVFALWELAEFTLLCKLLKHSFGVL